jgi:predicted metal-dependent hydrolase
MARPEAAQLSLLPDAPPASDRHCLELAGQTIEYTISRSARRRRITLTIDERGLRVGAPPRASLRSIEAVLKVHAAWVVCKLDEWHARRPAPFVWAAGEQVMVLGEPLTLAPDPAQPVTARVGDRLLVAAPDNADLLAQAVVDWLRAAALEWFIRRSRHFAPIIGVKIPLIRLSNARTRWGTCHPHGRVHLNWRLIQMPPALADYVVVHELAHLREANHSPRFWRHVEAVLPDHAARRKLLRTDAHHYLLP